MLVLNEAPANFLFDFPMSKISPFSNPGDFTELSGSRRRIFESAVRVFSRTPIEVVTLEMIAKQAGVSISLILKHFESKANLYYCVFDRIMSAHNRRMQESLQGWKRDRDTSPEKSAAMLVELLEDLIDGLYDGSAKNGRRGEILIFEMLYPSEFYDEFYEKHFRIPYQLFPEIFLSLMEGDDFREAFYQSVVFLGQILSFRIERELLVRSTSMQGFHSRECRILKDLVLYNTAQIIGNPVLKERFSRPPEVRNSRSPLSAPPEERESDFWDRPDSSLASVRRILKASQRLFTDHPFESVSLVSIAEAARVKVPLMMYHFKNKENLYRTVLEEVVLAHQKRSLPCFDFLENRGVRSREEAARILCELVDVIMDGMYSPENSQARGECLLLQEITFPSRLYEGFYHSFFQPHYEKFAEVIRAAGGHKNRTLSHLQAVSIFGMIISFRLERNVILRSLQTEVSDPKAFSQIKALIKRNTLSILGLDPEAFLEKSPGGSRGRDKTSSSAAPKKISPRTNFPQSRSDNYEEKNSPYNGGQTREKILSAAIRIFSQVPYDMTTISSVAKEAGVNHTLLLYHFKSKKTLYRVVLRRSIDAHIRNLQPFFESVENSPSFSREEAKKILAQILRAMLGGLDFLSEKGRCYVKILLFEVYFPSEFYQEVYEKYFRRYYSMMIRLVRSIDDSLDYETTVFQCTQIFGLLVGYDMEHEILQRFIGSRRKTGEEQGRIHEQIIQNAFTLLGTDPEEEP